MAAFRLDPTANTKYNEALAWSKAARPAAAADAYEAALTFGGLSDKLTGVGTDRLATLKNKLGRLVINQPLGANISVAHATRRGIPAKIHLSPGQHAVTVHHADSSDQSKTITIVAGSDTEVSFEPRAAASTPEPAPVPAPPEQAPDNPALTISGWTLVGLGGATLVATGVVGGLTLGTVSDYDDTGNTDPELRDEAVTLKTTTNVLAGVGGGLAALGVGLLIANAVGDDTETARVRPTANGLVVSF